MYHWLRDFISKLIYDEAWFERWSRALLLALVGGMMDGTIPWPAWLPKGTFVLIMGTAGLLSGGQKNPSPEKIADELHEIGAIPKPGTGPGASVPPIPQISPRGVA